MKFEFYTKIIYLLFLSYLYNSKSYEINEAQASKIENYLIDNNYIKALKKVVYTALFGNYDQIHSINKEKGYDYFMFTEQNYENITTNWTIINVEQNMNFTNKIDVMKKQRFYKTHPHLFFKNYDLSIYIDATFEIKGNLDNFILRILTPNLSIYVFEHPFIDTIINEFKAILFFKKDSMKNIIPVREKYKREKFPDDNGHAECCMIVRKHNDKNCINLMEKWFYEIKHNSYRDQLSFNYVLWKTRNKIVKYISKHSINEYLNQSEHHLKIFNFTL